MLLAYRAFARWRIRKVLAEMRRLSGAFINYRSGVCGIELRPQALGAFHDLIAQHARPILVVAGVSFLPLETWKKTIPSLGWLAQAQEVTFQPDAAGDGNSIAREDLERLLAGISSHWNFRCWDAQRVPSPTAMSRLTGKVMEATRPCTYRPTLYLVDGARLFVDSHDDDHLSIEAYGPDLAQAVFARALESLVGRAIRDMPRRAGGYPLVAEAPPEIAHYFQESVPSFSLSTADVQAKPGRIRVNFTAIGNDQLDAEPSGYIDYDPQAGRWRHRYR